MPQSAAAAALWHASQATAPGCGHAKECKSLMRRLARLLVCVPHQEYTQLHIQRVCMCCLATPCSP